MTQERPGAARGPRPLRAQRRRDPDAGPLGLHDRGPLQRQARPARRRWTWNGPRTAAPASCSSSRRGPRPCSRRSRRDVDRDLPPAGAGHGARQRPERRREDRPGAGARDQERAATSQQFQRRRGPGHRQDRSRLGADHEEGRRHRHQPRRPHLPRGHRQPRAGPAGRRRHRARHRGAPATARRSPSPAPRATRALSTKACSTFEVERVDLEELGRPTTKIMMNVGNPEEAFRLSFMPNDGVGLAREEFIITHLHQGPSAGPARLRPARRPGRARRRSTG